MVTAELYKSTYPNYIMYDSWAVPINSKDTDASLQLTHCKCNMLRCLDVQIWWVCVDNNSDQADCFTHHVYMSGQLFYCFKHLEARAYS